MIIGMALLCIFEISICNLACLSSFCGHWLDEPDHVIGVGLVVTRQSSRGGEGRNWMLCRDVLNTDGNLTLRTEFNAYELNNFEWSKQGDVWRDLGCPRNGRKGNVCVVHRRKHRTLRDCELTANLTTGCRRNSEYKLWQRHMLANVVGAHKLRFIVCLTFVSGHWQT